MLTRLRRHLRGAWQEAGDSARRDMEVHPPIRAEIDIDTTTFDKAVKGIAESAVTAKQIFRNWIMLGRALRIQEMLELSLNETMKLASGEQNDDMLAQLDDMKARGRVSVMSEEATVTRYGMATMQVCVPEHWTDEQIVQFAEAQYESGIGFGWQIRREGSRSLDGDPERNPCAEYEGYVHVALEV